MFAKDQSEARKWKSLRLFFKDRSYMSVCILFPISYKQKYSCICTYKYNTEILSCETDWIKNPGNNCTLRQWRSAPNMKINIRWNGWNLKTLNGTYDVRKRRVFVKVHKFDKLEFKTIKTLLCFTSNVLCFSTIHF